MPLILISANSSSETELKLKLVPSLSPFDTCLHPHAPSKVFTALALCYSSTVFSKPVTERSEPNFRPRLLQSETTESYLRLFDEFS